MESLLKNIENTINSSISEFLDRIVEKYDQLDRKELLQLWNTNGPSEHNSKSKDKAKKELKDSSQTGCPYIMTKGAKKDTMCGTKPKDGSTYCSLHKDKADKVPKEKKILPEPLKTSKASSLNGTTLKNSSEEKIVLRKHPNFPGKFYHPTSNMVFHSAENKVVIGRLEDGKIRKLTDEDIETCKKWRFAIEGPPNTDRDEKDKKKDTSKEKNVSKDKNLSSKDKDKDKEKSKQDTSSDKKDAKKKETKKKVDEEEVEDDDNEDEEETKTKQKVVSKALGLGKSKDNDEEEDVEVEDEVEDE